jgi:hypothetical protein
MPNRPAPAEMHKKCAQVKKVFFMTYCVPEKDMT